MKLIEIFPRAMIMEYSRALHISNEVLGVDIEGKYIGKSNIFTTSGNELFDSIIEMVKNALHIAMKPFRLFNNVEDDDSLLKLYRYDYDSLLATAVFRTLDDLLDQFTFTFTSQAINRYDEMYSADFDIKYKTKVDRINKIQNSNKTRNESHLFYLHYLNKYIPVVKAKDVLYYHLLSENKSVRDFLYTNKNRINKSFIEKIEQVYESINKEFGYDKFAIEYRFEYDSKIDLFSHLTYILCELEKQNKIDKHTVEEQLALIGRLHKYKIFNHTDYELIMSLAMQDTRVSVLYETYFMSVNEMRCCNEGNYDLINGIVFGLNNIYEMYKSNYTYLSSIRQIIRDLNMIVTESAHCVANVLSSILAECVLMRHRKVCMGNMEYSCKNEECRIYNKEIFDFVYEICQSDDSITFFDEYMDKCKKEIGYHVITGIKTYRNAAKLLNSIYLYK